MKFLILLTVLIPHLIYANDCIYDDNSYSDFAKDYVSKQKQATLSEDFEITTTYKDSLVIVNGGGCSHLGYDIHYTLKQNINESEFFNLVIELTNIFGVWIGYNDQIKNAIAENKWAKEGNNYSFDFNGYPIFDASLNDQELYIEFYIN
ncbi:hypothetical protein [Marinicellulosiphila megalodicopiae]|uniref:hypothetical protein n=1 Tax=Marinicellulosiphila megalodicopiae TaxID=2724896 RepID=UPI003BB0B0A9